MTYPPPPWTLKGRALQTVHLIDVERVRSLVPPELTIVEVWPGKTLGGVYCAAYAAGSALLYNELIAIAATVRHEMQIGAWISHIYVDNPDSVAGGREIWGLPKELAEFTWERGDRDRVAVRQGDRLLCNLDAAQTNLRLPIPLSASSFSTLGSNLLLFPSEFNFNIGLVGGKLQVPPESPFAMLDLGQPFVTFSFEDLRVVVSRPEAIEERAIASTYAGV